MSVTLSFKGYSLIWHITYLEHTGNYLKKPNNQNNKENQLTCMCITSCAFSLSLRSMHLFRSSTSDITALWFSFALSSKICFSSSCFSLSYLSATIKWWERNNRPLETPTCGKLFFSYFSFGNFLLYFRLFYNYWSWSV